MGFGRYRFRRSFGNVKSQFRGARFDTYPLFSGILDSYPGAAAAYSLRALSSAWLAGDVVEVRRSSDSTTQSFTAAQVTDGTLEAFCGVGDGFVSTWYDQSGNGNDATQATTTAQPKIVSAGALVTGGLDFDGVDDTLNTTLVPPTTATLIGVSTWDTTPSTQMIVGARDSTNERSYISQTSSGDIALGVGSGAVGTQAAIALTEYLSFGKYNSGDNDIFVNAIASGSSATASPINTTYGYNIGSLNDAGASSGFINGRIREVIIYDSDQSANRVGIETNINDFYSIY